VSDLGLRDGLLAALAVGAVLLIAYQGFMLYWTRKTVGSIPRAVLVLRIVNIALLVAGCVLVVWQVAGD
jgi:hypothetical protein